MKTVRPHTSIAEIKSKFQSLKTNFLTEYKKVESSKTTGTGEDDVYIPTLWYFDKLQFLLDHSVPRRTEDSIDAVIFQATDEMEENRPMETSQVYDEVNDVIYDFTSSVNEGEVQVDVTNKAPIITPGTSKSSTPASSQSGTPGANQLEKKSKVAETQVFEEATTVLESLVKSLETPSQTTAMKSSEDVFGELVATKLKVIENAKIKNKLEAQILDMTYKAILQYTEV
ncbi:hypothetical protein ILUMI_09477 [Ignelater luminosus]|uniref:MADF domain-containing protein n=1 Tax=Ignelater luminosus TaxID=2038154 RepID=A0A8K0D3S7_IGNLU|nr:hypothetical protein ILUMI_09477 [Ignelater luminosus]